MWWNKYIGTPFKEKGRDQNGVDCWGLLRIVYKNELGIDLPDYLECYESTNDKEVLSSLISREKDQKWEPIDKPTEFSALVLKMDGVPFHVGVYTHDGKFIHCARGSNTVHEKINSFRWRNNVAGVYTWAR